MSKKKCERCNQKKLELVDGICWKCKIGGIQVTPIEVRRKFK